MRTTLVLVTPPAVSNLKKVTESHTYYAHLVGMLKYYFDKQLLHAYHRG